MQRESWLIDIYLQLIYDTKVESSRIYSLSKLCNIFVRIKNEQKTIWIKLFHFIILLIRDCKGVLLFKGNKCLLYSGYFAIWYIYRIIFNKFIFSKKSNLMTIVVSNNLQGSYILHFLYSFKEQFLVICFIEL